MVQLGTGVLYSITEGIDSQSTDGMSYQVKLGNWHTSIWHTCLTLPDVQLVGWVSMHLAYTTLLRVNTVVVLVHAICTTQVSRGVSVYVRLPTLHCTRTSF